MSSVAPLLLTPPEVAAVMFWCFWASCSFLLWSRTPFNLSCLFENSSFIYPWVQTDPLTHSWEAIYYILGLSDGLYATILEKKVFKLRSKVVYWSSSWVSLPKSIYFLVFNQLVVRVVSCGLFEWRVSSIHNEENDSCSKNVTFRSIIIFSWNFRCHISLSTQFGMKNSCSVFSFNHARKAEIS